MVLVSSPERVIQGVNCRLGTLWGVPGSNKSGIPVRVHGIVMPRFFQSAERGVRDRCELRHTFIPIQPSFYSSERRATANLYRAKDWDPHNNVTANAAIMIRPQIIAEPQGVMALISGNVTSAVLSTAWNKMTAKTLFPVLLKIHAISIRIPTSVMN